MGTWSWGWEVKGGQIGTPPRIAPVHAAAEGSWCAVTTCYHILSTAHLGWDVHGHPPPRPPPHGNGLLIVLSAGSLKVDILIGWLK